jgi:YHS domain-containing protein
MGEIAVVGLSFGLTAGLAAAAQKPAEKAKPGQAMSMEEMKKGCREHCQATQSKSQQTSAMIEEAKRSGDPAKMKAALEEAQKRLGEMNEHMSACMRSMGMMGEMHGGMGMMSGQAAPAAAKATDPVCGMAVDPATAPKATYKGKTYYFCSTDDKAKFEKDPAKYVKPPSR